MCWSGVKEPKRKTLQSALLKLEPEQCHSNASQLPPSVHPPDLRRRVALWHPERDRSQDVPLDARVGAQRGDGHGRPGAVEHRVPGKVEGGRDGAGAPASARARPPAEALGRAQGEVAEHDRGGPSCEGEAAEGQARCGGGAAPADRRGGGGAQRREAAARDRAREQDAVPRHRPRQGAALKVAARRRDAGARVPD